jgi:DNA-directed RNA polymerase subunit N (RpoN/RPB10)
MSCPSCGYLLGQDVIKYESEKNKICSNPKLTQDEKDEKMSVLHKSLGLKRYCCKTRIMTYKKLVDDIIPVKND